MSKKQAKGTQTVTTPKQWPYDKQQDRDQMAERMLSARRKLARVRKDDRLPPDLVILLYDASEDLLIGMQLAIKDGAPIRPEEL